jgi:hypothetical protein
MTNTVSQADSDSVSFDVSPPACAFVSDDDAITVEIPAPVFEPDPPTQEILALELSSQEIGTVEVRGDEDLSVELPLAERRGNAREVLRVEARIRIDGEPPLEANTIDLSSHGVAITATRPLNVGCECIVELGVSASEIATPPALRASVRYCARLREDRFRIGMKFTAVSIEAAELIVAVLGL